MRDIPDIELRTPPEWPAGPPPRRPTGPWIAAGVFLVAAAIAAYFVFWGPSTPAPAAVVTPPPATEVAPPAPLGSGDVEPMVLPPLDATDALVRELLRALSTHPRIAAWLATDGLIRNFAASVSNVSEGKTPVTHLATLSPTLPFGTMERGRDLVIDPRSYERYDHIASAVASVDPAAGARLYTTLKPRIEDAYRELGFPEGSFDRALERAIVLLLETPAAADPVGVEPKGIVYGFADERLEALAPSQKQLLRFGPRNMRLIQRQLREIALALGVPAVRLPTPRL